MTSILVRVCCALLSTVGAAGLVAFANPANAIGSVRAAAPTTAVAATMPAAIAQRG